MRELYVSEFTRFMDGFLAEHPEVADDMRRRCIPYWEDQELAPATGVPEEDEVPFDTYEANPPARADWVAQVIRH